MGGKGGGSTATNDQMVQMQQQQAAQTEEANPERNARLTSGAAEINAMFQGHPAGATQLDMSQVGFGGAQQYGGWQFNPVTGQPEQVAQTPGSSGYYYKVMPDSGSGTANYGLYDPQGNLITTSPNLSDLAKTQVWIGGDPSKTEGGFDDAFYNKYKQAQLDYYMPQESDQYATAKSNLLFQLARAGTADSSLAGYDEGKLAKQDVLNKAQIASQADTATGQLKNQIQQEQESALNQLYSTEDPTVAANTAQGMVANAALTKPILNPIGPMFSAITAGIGNAYTGFTNPFAYVNPNAGNPGVSGGQTGTGSNVTV